MDQVDARKLAAASRDFRLESWKQAPPKTIPGGGTALILRCFLVLVRLLFAKKRNTACQFFYPGISVLDLLLGIFDEVIPVYVLFRLLFSLDNVSRHLYILP